MGILCLVSLQGCSDDANTGDTSTGGTTGGSSGSGGTTGGSAGSGGSSAGSGGKGGTTSSGGTSGGTAGSGGKGGTAGTGGDGASGGGAGGGGAGGGTAGTGGGGAGGSGGGSEKAARCEVYCADFEETCETMFTADYGDAETCKTDCEEWDLGTAGASGPTIECRIQHTTNAKTMQTEVHCGHARKVPTGQCN